MIPVKLLAVLILAAHGAFGKSCNGKCGQGEGDCDRNSDCLPGLICGSDWWFWTTDYCKAGPNTKNYGWGAWGDWDACSVQCGGDGTQERLRKCTPPENGGFPCPSETDSDQKSCNNGPCPVDGGWSDFGDWTECSVDCGGGDRIRTRYCNNPAPQYGGNDCTGDVTESEKCNESPCPINGLWSNFDDWTECSVECGGGDRFRTRYCNNPEPQYGGNACTGDGTESEKCNESPCPDPIWCHDMACSLRIAKRKCPLTCGGYVEDETEELTDKPTEEPPASDPSWCQDIDCTTFIGKITCPVTCSKTGEDTTEGPAETTEEPKEETTASDPFWCNEIDCTTPIGKKSCPLTCPNTDCIEHGYHYLGGQQLAAPEIDGVATPEKCQELCNRTDGCNWFSWSDLRLPNGCWLLSKNGDTKFSDYGRDKGANGPKSCDG